MKIRSHILSTLLVTTASVAAGFLSFQVAPAQAANLLKNPNYQGATGGDWGGFADTTSGFVFQSLDPVTTAGETYQISLDAFVNPSLTLFEVQLQTDFDSNTTITLFDRSSLSNLSGNNFLTRTFTGNGANRLLFNYTFTDPTASIELNNINIDLFTASTTPTSVPEPFTIVGTLIGGTAALRLRNRLKSRKKISS